MSSWTIICIVMAFFSLVMFMFAINKYVHVKNKRMYYLSLSMFLIAIAWAGLGIMSYLNYLTQISL